MVKYKGRVFFRQYMPKKPIKWGIKVWMLAEPKTGYVSNFAVYLGKCASSEHAGQTLGTRVVLDMSKLFHHTATYTSTTFSTLKKWLKSC